MFGLLTYVKYSICTSLSVNISIRKCIHSLPSYQSLRLIPVIAFPLSRTQSSAFEWSFSAFALILTLCLASTWYQVITCFGCFRKEVVQYGSYEPSISGARQTHPDILLFWHVVVEPQEKVEFALMKIVLQKSSFLLCQCPQKSLSCRTLVLQISQ